MAEQIHKLPIQIFILSKLIGLPLSKKHPSERLLLKGEKSRG